MYGTDINCGGESVVLLFGRHDDFVLDQWFVLPYFCRSIFYHLRNSLMHSSIFSSRPMLYRALYIPLAVFCLLCTAGCSKDESPTGSSDTEITSEFYIQATIEGAAITLQSGKSSYGYGVSGHFGGGSGSGYLAIARSYLRRSSFQSGEVVVDPKNSMTIAFVKRFGKYPSDAEYESMLYPGDIIYGSEKLEIDGVEINWTDATNKTWTSRSNDSNNKFTVTSHEKIKYFPGESRTGLYLTKATFSCTLYDNTGQSIDITNGKFALRTLPVH